MKRPVLFLNKLVCIHNNRRTRFEKISWKTILRLATKPSPQNFSIQNNFEKIFKNFDVGILRNFVKMAKMGQIFIQNGPSEVVGLTQPVLGLTNLESPHHIFRSRTFLISYVITKLLNNFFNQIRVSNNIPWEQNFLGTTHRKPTFAWVSSNWRFFNQKMCSVSFNIP